MTESSLSKDGLVVAAWDDLRRYVTRPSIYQYHANLNQFFKSLWMVYLCKSGAFASFDEFHDAAKAKAEFFRKQMDRKK